MKIIKGWQYKYIEQCIYQYKKLMTSLSTGCLVDTELKALQAINDALAFFDGTIHEKMMKEYYFNAEMYRDEMSKNEHYKYVCESLLHTEQPNGYVIRREIVYRIAMNFYKMGLFST